MDIIREENKSSMVKSRGRRSHPTGNPERFLDDYVIGQSHAKRVLSVAVHNSLQADWAHAAKNQDVELAKVEHPDDRPNGLRPRTLLAQDAGPDKSTVPFTMADADEPLTGSPLCRRGCPGKKNIILKLLQFGRLQCRACPAAASSTSTRSDKEISRKSDKSPQSPATCRRGVQQALLKNHGRHRCLRAAQGGRKHPSRKFLQVEHPQHPVHSCAAPLPGLERGSSPTAGSKTFDRLRGQRSSPEEIARRASSSARSSREESAENSALIPKFVGSSARFWLRWKISTRPR